MKKILFIILLSSLTVTRLVAQTNLVPNPSFEDTLNCPYSGGLINYALHWYSGGFSPDYLNACAEADVNSGVGIPSNWEGHQHARTGNGYAGIYTFYAGGNFREYIETQLDSALLPQHTYCVEFYVSLGDTIPIACNNIGVYFSPNSVYSASELPLNVTPQIENNTATNPLTDKIGWTKVSGSFVATGGEDFITIGNFLNDINSDTVMLVPGAISVSYYYIEDVSVVDCTGLGITNLSDNQYYKLYPNPSNGNFRLDYRIANNQTGVLSIYDLAGKLISSYAFNSANTSIKIDENKLNAGAYFYNIKVNDQQVKMDKLIIIK